MCRAHAQKTSKRTCFHKSKSIMTAHSVKRTRLQPEYMSSRACAIPARRGPLGTLNRAPCPSRLPCLRNTANIPHAPLSFLTLVLTNPCPLRARGSSDGTYPGHTSGSGRAGSRRCGTDARPCCASLDGCSTLNHDPSLPSSLSILTFLFTHALSLSPAPFWRLPFVHNPVSAPFSEAIFVSNRARF